VLSIGIGVLGVEQAGLLITLVTFGALTAYILLNVAVVNHFIVRGKSRRFFLHLVSPVVGTAILLFALWSANPNAKLLGVCWVAVGLAVAAFFKATGRSMQQSDL
jgi:amino acid transporter